MTKLQLSYVPIRAYQRWADANLTTDLVLTNRTLRSYRTALPAGIYKRRQVKRMGQGHRRAAVEPVSDGDNASRCQS